MMECIFGHVGSISGDFVDSNRMLTKSFRAGLMGMRYPNGRRTIEGLRKRA
jgi:hypothetical protein